VNPYETLIIITFGVVLFLCGALFGRRLERYEIYMRLMASRDPEARDAAQRLRKGHPALEKKP